MGYHSWNLRRGLRLVVLDGVLILAAVLLAYFGRQQFAAVNGTAQDVTLPVLLYHSVCQMPESDFCITPETFAADLAYLQAQGYETVSAEDLIAYTSGDGVLPAKPVMLTFDDGLYNNLSLVLPLLEQYEMCAVVSVVGTYADVFAPDAPHQDNYSYLTWADLGALLDSGRIELGSHTYDLHTMDTRLGAARMAGEPEDQYRDMLLADLTRLQQRFGEELAIQPIVFAYPYGFVCDESKPVLREMGFQITLTSLEQSNTITRDPACLYGLGRFNRPGGVDSATFLAGVL